MDQQSFFLQNSRYVVIKNLWILLFLIFPSLWVIALLFGLRECLLYFTTRFKIQEDKITIKKGLFSTNEVFVLKTKINNIEVQQNILNKLTQSYSIVILTGNDLPSRLDNISENDYNTLKKLNYLK